MLNNQNLYILSLQAQYVAVVVSLAPLVILRQIISRRILKEQFPPPSPAKREN